MKRTQRLSYLLVLCLSGCARNPAAPPPPGGQSGDDGDVTPDNPQPIDPVPGLPAQPCEPEGVEVELAAGTLFGGSPLELVARVAPAAQSPLFWVAYDSIAGTSFTPGPGQAALTLGVEARAGEPATQITWQPRFGDAVCPDATLSVPVRVGIQTSDGALDEGVDSALVFSSASTAHLEAELFTSALAGTFVFQQIGAPEQGWQAERLSLNADLWPGGSRGEISPTFTQSPVTPPSGPATPPTAPTSAAAPSGATGSSIAAPVMPQHWRSVAVWPRREACDGEGRGPAAAYLVEDQVIGASLADAVSALVARSNRTLVSAAGTTAVQLRVDVPLGLQCVRVSGSTMAFDVRATLVAGSAATPPLEHLAAASVFELTATQARDGSGLEALHWSRRDVVTGQSRAAFEAATGIVLEAPAQYQQVWWSWHGMDTRESLSAPWTAQGELVVSSLSLEQANEIARVVAQGGPGVGISFEEGTGFPVLPGDALLEAEILP